jgi:hypothetical protein
MKKVHLLLPLLLTTLAASSQKVYFVYIQSENKQPFYVKQKETLYSSSASGYIIMSKLLDTTYSFGIGLAQSAEQPKNFSIPINKKDHGYLLKNFGDKGWGLFDLQTLEVKMSGGATAKANEGKMPDNKDVPAFTEGLSKAAGDPSLKERPVQPVVVEEKKIIPIPEEKKPEVAVEKPKAPEPVIQPEIKTVVVADIPVEKKEEPKIEPVKEQPATKIEPITETPVEEYKMSVVAKKSESSTTEGFGLTYTDIYPNGSTDTIKLLIPEPKTPQAVVKAEPAPAEIPVKAGCINTATEADFFQLRKLMAAAESDDAMIMEAKNVCKVKCFTTTQYKNLGSLFLTDEGKYKFFDAIYNYTSDSANFSSLQSELKDEYYITRFKAMLRN